MEYKVIRFLNKFKPTYYLSSLILIALTDHWMHKFRNQTTYPDIGYVAKFFPSELTSFIGILIVLRCFSLSRHGMIKYVASISIFTLLDWMACSVDHMDVIIRPTCFILQVILIAYRSYQFYRGNATNSNIYGSSTDIIGFLYLSEIMGYKPYFTDHLKLVYLTAIMLPEGIIPSLTPEEKSKLFSIDHLRVLYARLYIIRAYPFFSMYWLFFRIFNIINNDETGNSWCEIFGSKLESPIEVFSMVWVVTFITYHVSHLLRVYLFQTNVPLDTPFLLLFSCEQFVFLLDDGIWNMEREQQWKTIKLTLFIPLIQILIELDSWSRSYIHHSQRNGLSVECATVFAKMKTFGIIWPSVIIVWMCAWTDEFNARSLFVACLALKQLGAVIMWPFSVPYISNEPDYNARHCEQFYANFLFCLEQFWILGMTFFETLILFYIGLPGIFRIWEAGTNIWVLCSRLKQLVPALAQFWRIELFMYGLEDARENGMGIEELGVCVICLQEMEVACVLTHCKHCFHWYCFEKYLYNFNNNLCPLCRWQL